MIKNVMSLKAKINNQTKFIRKKKINLHSKNSLIKLTDKYQGLRKTLDNIKIMH